MLSYTNNSRDYEVTRDMLLQEINAHEVKALFPLIFTYACILIIGVIGNGMVLIVYSLRYKRSPARVYILFLASIDFAVCLIGLPYHMTDLTHPYTYTDILSCKILSFIMGDLFHVSVFSLIVIAIDRYLKICRPLGKLQVSYFGKKRACFVAVALSIIISWPFLVLYGPSEMETSTVNVTGHACFFHTAYLDTKLPFIFSLTLLCVCLCSTLFLVIMYSLICYHIIMRYKGICGHVTDEQDDTTMTVEYNLKNITQSTPLTTSPATSVEHVNAEHRIHQPICEVNTDQDLQTVMDSSSTLTGSGNMCTKIERTNGSSDQVDCGINSFDNKHKISYHIINTILYKSLSTEALKPYEDMEKALPGHNENAYTDVNKLKDNSNFETNDTEHEVLIDTKCECNITGSIALIDEDANVNIPSEFDVEVENVDDDNVSESTRNGNNISDRRPYNVNYVDKTIQNDINNHYGVNSENNISKTDSNDQIKYVSIQQTQCLNVPDIKNRQPELLERRNSDHIQVYCKREPSLINHRCNSLSLLSHHTTVFSAGNLDGLRIHTSCVSMAHSIRSSVKIKSPISRQHYKITKIMFTITLVFVLSYTPVFVITIWSTVNPSFWDDLSEAETILCEFFLRIYLLNNICNPFIYGFWDRRFKREIIFILRKLFRYCRSCIKT